MGATSASAEVRLSGMPAQISTAVFKCTMCCPILIGHPAAGEAVKHGWMYDRRKGFENILESPTDEALQLQAAEDFRPKILAARLEREEQTKALLAELTRAGETPADDGQATADDNTEKDIPHDATPKS